MRREAIVEYRDSLSMRSLVVLLPQVWIFTVECGGYLIANEKTSTSCKSSERVTIKYKRELPRLYAERKVSRLRVRVSISAKKTRD